MRTPQIKTTVECDNETPVKALIDNMVIRNAFETDRVNRRTRDLGHHLDVITLRFGMGRQSGHSKMMFKFFSHGLQVKNPDSTSTTMVQQYFKDAIPLLTNGWTTNCAVVFDSERHLKQFRDQFGINKNEKCNTRLLLTSHKVPTKPDPTIEFIFIDDMFRSTYGDTNSSPCINFFRNSPDRWCQIYPNLKGIIVLQ